MVPYCKSAIKIFLYHDLFQNGTILIIFEIIQWNILIKLKSSKILNLLRKNDTIFQKTVVYEGLQYDGIQKPVALQV